MVSSKRFRLAHGAVFISLHEICEENFQIEWFLENSPNILIQVKCTFTGRHLLSSRKDPFVRFLTSFLTGKMCLKINVYVNLCLIYHFYFHVYRLLRLTETGSSDVNRGAVLNTARVTAMLIIPANDDPYGVISWKNTLIISQEDGPKNTSLSVYIMRQFGLIGDVVVSYETVQLSSVAHDDEREAMPGVDYQAVRGTVEIPAGLNLTQITLDVTHVSLDRLAIV